MDILEVEGIKKAFGDKRVLESLSFGLAAGELVCIIGKSGCGKSTLFHIVAGLLAPDGGHVRMEGADITGQPGHVSYMLQKDLLLPFRTVEDNVILPLIISGMKKQEARARAGDLFEEFGLSGTEKLWPSELSGGMRQRAALMRTYLFSAKVALLDEPFSALDALTKASMYDWYLKIQSRLSLSTLFITHDIDEALTLADRILVLGNRPASVIDEIVPASSKPRGANYRLSEEYQANKARLLEGLE
ncbi:MAG: ABC transporter ATP-binding protein [Lachnospiraceae bacterium]|nr:ABC transporter ATP-binding protein [Lachnospiraceae bacterium]